MLRNGSRRPTQLPLCCELTLCFSDRPERWLSGVPESTKAIPNVWGPVMTFGAGPHSCIGYRFSVIETKIIMYTIINAFNFRLGVEAVEVGKFNTGIVLRPCMKAEREKGPGLPVIVSKV
jgi:cytochrome P450